MKSFLAILFFTLIPDKGISQEIISIHQFDWLIGNWSINYGKSALREDWFFVNDSTLRADSYLLNSKGKKIPFETIELKIRNGIAYYVPSVKNQNNGVPIEFRIVQSDTQSFISENLQHDYPQRIIYTLKSADELFARIEGTQNGKFRSDDFPMKRSLQ